MQIFRAYVRDAAGIVTWAAWIEAADLAEAQGKADVASGGRSRVVDPWFPSRREIARGDLEAV
jgi:hypothetical protein